MHKNILSALLVVVLALVSGCTSNALCAKKQECDDNRSDDDVNVCIANYNRGIDKLRANKEKECQALADAQLAFDACRAALDCDNFVEQDLGQKCDQETKDLRSAQQDAISGGQFQCDTFD